MRFKIIDKVPMETNMVSSMLKIIHVKSDNMFAHMLMLKINNAINNYSYQVVLNDNSFVSTSRKYRKFNSITMVLSV